MPATTPSAASIEEALDYMKLEPGAPIKGTKVDVAFIGSCTNGRLSDFREAAKFLQGHKVAEGVKAIAVPGSEIVAQLCTRRGSTRSSRPPVSNGAAPAARCAWR